MQGNSPAPLLHCELSAKLSSLWLIPTHCPGIPRNQVVLLCISKTICMSGRHLTLLPAVDEVTLSTDAGFHLWYSLYAPPSRSSLKPPWIAMSREHKALGRAIPESVFAEQMSFEKTDFPRQEPCKPRGWKLWVSKQSLSMTWTLQRLFFALGSPYIVYRGGSVLHQTKGTTAQVFFFFK